MLIGGNQQEKDHLLGPLREIIHDTFVKDKDFDRRTLGCYLECDYLMVVRKDGQPVGFHMARPRMIDGHKLLHLSGAFLLPQFRGQRLIIGWLVRANLCLAARHFKSQDFWVAVRTNQPRVVGTYADSEYFSLFPQPGHKPLPENFEEVAPLFAAACYPGQEFDAVRGVFPGIFPPESAIREDYWHHDDRVNGFFKSRVDHLAGDALFLMGRTKPPLPDRLGPANDGEVSCLKN